VCIKAPGVTDFEVEVVVSHEGIFVLVLGMKKVC
jgi:hypothetical protein